MGTWMRLRWGRKLSSVLISTLLLGGANLTAQPGKTETPIGAERVKAILTQQAHWTVYWSRLGAAPRPPATAVSGIVQFTRLGDKILGHLSIPVFREECDFEVVVKDDGFTYPGCTRVDKDVAYDPADQEYPFKGSMGAIVYWFRPE
jgi:hypothetical protein